MEIVTVILLLVLLALFAWYMAALDKWADRITVQLEAVRKSIDQQLETAEYDEVGRLASDAVAHAEQVNVGNVKRWGGKAKMGPDEKLRNALDYMRLHWTGSADLDQAGARRRIESELWKWRHSGVEEEQPSQEGSEQ